MNTCTHCGTANAVENKFCQQCGRSIEAGKPPPSPTISSNATVRWTGEAVASRGGLRHTVPLEVLFASKTRLVIGRSRDCDITLPHPMISRQHALLERTPEGLRLCDLDSVNGVFVNGQRISEPVYVQERERIGVGPFLFACAGGLIYSLDNSQSLRLAARGLEKVVSLGGGQTRKLLDDINLVVEPGEFISLLGPSGSGKTTLMDCLNGRRWATGGSVLANGEDFYRHFDSFRQSLGYVPQRDIVHTQLSVYRALYYTARLRLPTDTEPAELWDRIEEVLQLMELGPHRHTLVANLSGGQIKRVSLGAELLARPCLLYIDEATSGLDAGTEARMMRLFRQLADEGKTVLCITHNVDNVDRCNLILMLARGKLVYYGPPKEALGYFGVHRLSEIYDRLADKEPAIWEQEFRDTPLHEEFITKRLAAGPSESSALLTPPAAPVSERGGPTAEGSAPSAARESSAPPASGPAARAPRRRAPLWHQFTVLTTRYVELLWSDRRSLRLILLQAPIVALFILFGFVAKPYQKTIPTPRELQPDERQLLAVVQCLSQAVDADRAPEPAERQALQKIKLTVGDGPTTLTAAEALDLAHALQDVSEALEPNHELTPADRKELEKIKLTVAEGGPPLDAVQAVKVLRQLQMLARRLDSNREVGPDQRKALANVRLTLADGKTTITATQAAELLHGLDLLTRTAGANRKLTPSEEAELKKIKVTLEGSDTTLNALEAEDQLGKFVHSGIVPQLLTSKGPIVPAGEIINPQYTYMLLFLVAITILWFGCNNAAKEIVKEEAIYGRERAVNLGILPYLSSKFLVLSFVSAVQTLIMMVLIYGVLEALHATLGLALPPSQYRLEYVEQFGVLVLLAMTGVALGLLLSACVATPDRANALLPYVLIPQIILGGGIMPIKDGPLHAIAVVLSPVYWAFRAIRRGATELPDVLPYHMNYNDSVGLACAALVAQMFVLLLLTAWFLKRKDVRRA
jgi:ABC-type multidrug transport system ATPase subunit